MNRYFQRTALPALLLLATAAPSPAGIFFPHNDYHPTPEPGKPRHFCHTQARAGFPQTLRNHLEPTNAGDSIGYYVGGGGGGHAAGPRCREEGTFGWDYLGACYPRRVALGWNQGRRYQGGTGSYRTDEPFPVPNVFTLDLLGGLHRRGEE